MSLSYIKGPDISDRPKRFNTIGECLNHYATKLDDKEAVVFRSTTDSRCVVTWRELCDKSYKVAKAFVHLGIKPGECIAVVTRTCPEWLYVAFGAMLVGARVTTIVFTYKDGSDVIKLMEKIGNCSLIVLDPGIEESNWNILMPLLDERTVDGRVRSAKLPFLRYMCFIQSPENENVTTVNQLLEQDHNAVQLPEVDPNDVGIFFQTSGSTGVPKLVAHTYGTVIGFADLVPDDFDLHDFSLYNDRPFGWVGGFPSQLFMGQKRITVSGFCPDPVDRVSFLIDVIMEERVSMATLFAPMLHELGQRHADLPSDWPLKTIMYGGQPVTKSITSYAGKICQSMLVAYGGTEFLYGTVLPIENPETYEECACGAPIPGVELKMVNEDDEIVPRGERGHVYVRNGAIFVGYLNDPQKTAEVKTSDGWYKTGDIGRVDLNGCVFIEGRISETIISGGMNVSPAILEAVLEKFPGIEAACVVPVPDKVMYQVVCACVCVKKGSNITEVTIRDFMEKTHNDQQKLFTVLPKYYMILEEFPEVWTGKHSRKKLVTMAEERFNGDI